MPNDIIEGSGFQTRPKRLHQNLDAITINTGGKRPGTGIITKRAADRTVALGPEPTVGTGLVDATGNPYGRISAMTAKWDARFDDPTYYG